MTITHSHSSTDSQNAAQDKEIRLVVYTSEYTGHPTQIHADLQSIVSVARRNNASLNITGAIFHQCGRFLQFLEGCQPGLQTLLNKIGQDSRHRNIRFLFDEPITERGFSEWSLDSFDLNPADPLNLKMLERIRDVYRCNFLTNSNTLVGIYKAFVQENVVSTGVEITV